ncbi:hypothetical protein MBLNU13_g09631t1 [Cladosporium sp. NU13]
MAPSADLDHNTAKGLLRPFGQYFPNQEEERRSWSVDRSLFSTAQLVNPFIGYSAIYKELRAKPLLRVWDTLSGSIPDKSCGNRMLARLSRGELATIDTRKTSLVHHANQTNKVPTPYISFTSSLDAAVKLANERLRPRGDQHIVVIDPWYRLQRGLPILDMGKEMEEYGVKNPYREDYYTDHYICLWEVTPEEVVDTWSCNCLRQVDGWYENIIIPAFRKHRETH